MFPFPFRSMAFKHHSVCVSFPFYLNFVCSYCVVCVCIIASYAQPRAPSWLTRNQQKLYSYYCTAETWCTDWQGVPAEDRAMPTCKHYILKLFVYCNLNYPIITWCHEAIKIATGSFKAKSKKPIVSLASRQAAEPSLFSSEISRGTEQFKLTCLVPITC